jgi:hypothetical protein
MGITISQELITVTLFLIAQTGAGIWWASKMNYTGKYLVAEIEELKRTLSGDGFARCQLHDQWMRIFDQRIGFLERQRKDGGYYEQNSRDHDT